MSQDALLDIRNATVTFGSSRSKTGTVALEHLSLSIAASKPQIITVAGESGSGKTTLTRLVLGMIKPTQGEIFYKGKDIWKLSKPERRLYRHEVQAIFQDPFAVYNPFYPVDRLLFTPLRSFGIARNRAQARQMVEAALERVGLRANEILGRFPHQLSGGQRQRIVVARSLLLEPRLIVADEPVSMIDASLRVTILENLKQLRDELGISLLYITHDLATAHQISDQLIVLYRGRVVERGDASAVIQSPQHPYTQLLVSSIPQPDPNNQWDEKISIPLEELGGADRKGCLFRHRCPFVMQECNEQQPSYYQAESGQSVACYLLRDKQSVTAKEKAS